MQSEFLPCKDAKLLSMSFQQGAKCIILLALCKYWYPPELVKGSSQFSVGPEGNSCCKLFLLLLSQLTEFQPAAPSTHYCPVPQV